MGHDSDEPRPSFDYWASFPGQGVYFDPTLNVNGRRSSFSGYTTDVLTTLALDWLRDHRDPKQPYHGVWDANGLYDLQTDPHERHNLVDVTLS